MERRNQIMLNVNWEKYFDPKNIVLNTYLAKYGDDFLIDALLTVEVALQENLPIIPLIQFRDSDIISLVKKPEYPLVLHKLLILCEYLEKYEICEMVLEVQKQFYGERRVIPKSLKEYETTIILTHGK